ncbi:MAG: pyridoxamine 5'-phosphate oxidase [Planctomycetes bacterium]|nr:pyridoxamine 5'-phosphate oxidase [Planctomycetota bacterium]
MDLNDIGTEFKNPPLKRSDLPDDPYLQFERWMARALKTKVTQPNAMTLATVNPEGQPSSRILYLKAVDNRGFVFFTNYQSRKAGELVHNSKAALAFYWPDLDQQVRIEGTVEETTEEESDGYFASRSQASQWGAWASKQSHTLTSRNALDAQYVAAQKQFPDAVPRPPYWGGYRLCPTCMEFWQGRMNRCHDRFQYQRSTDEWIIKRLSP